MVLVGKGITFDSGGLDIKPPEGMLSMKRDMSGGAAVLATMAALRDVGCPVRVVGLVPAAENAISGSAMRPGDVVRHYGGRTSEVNNTDAEGRLVMADAMAYAVAELRPDVLVDIATLTGAMKVALGQGTGGYFANDEGIAAALAAAADESGELLWRMPLVADYEDKIASKVADGDNAAGGPGAITAALFLQHFAGDVPWAHIDFASIAEAPAERYEWTAGPTGFGPRVLLHLARVGVPARGGRPMRGLTVRWSLADAPEGVEERAGVVRRRDLARPLHRHGRAAASRRGGCAPGEWFEGCYVFGSDEARAEFQRDVHRGRRRGAGLADHRQRADPHRGVRRSSRSPRAGTASPPRRRA